MNTLSQLKERLAVALKPLIDDPAELLDMVRQSQEPKFGDYQANFAMPLGKQLGRPPREVAAEIVERLDVSDLCDSPEIAGPGFINLRLTDDTITDQINRAANDPRLGVATVEKPRTYIVDYSAPNVAKPMHVGHIRSTVIGDALCRTLRFLGHKAISDNHIGDWGTQFGMIIYGFRNFVDRAAYEATPVAELARLYRLVRRVMDYNETQKKLPELAQKIEEAEAKLAEAKAAAGDTPDKKTAKALRRQEGSLNDQRVELKELQAKLDEMNADTEFAALAADHTDIGTAVLAETAKLHSGDEENLKLWQEFLPNCLDEISRVYNRLNITFDHTLGESFYHDRLAPVVNQLVEQGVAIESNGAICVFLDGFDVPMLIRKKDGAFLYATTDLATVEYRIEEFNPDAILYVVDHRQSMHFEHLFATLRKMGYTDIELQHVSFGTVLGNDGRPFKTRSGDTVGLEGLLDEAVRRALKIVSDNDDSKPNGRELSDEQRQTIAERVGIAALKYADLSQNRTSDYTFDYDKMLAMNGNTATYMQYAYARVRSIFARGKVDVEALRASDAKIQITTPEERALALELLRFGEALDMAIADYRPNQLTLYLFGLAARYSSFFEQCPVLKAEDETLRESRLLLCDLTARVIAQGLELLGIETVEKM